jgi:hypothetical protein
MQNNITVLLLLLFTMVTIISEVSCGNRTHRVKRRVVFIKGSKFFVSVKNTFFFTCGIFCFLNCIFPVNIFYITKENGNVVIYYEKQDIIVGKNLFSGIERNKYAFFHS